MKKIFKCAAVNYRRSFSNKMGMIISVIMLPLIVLFSFYMNSSDQAPMRIAVIGNAPQLVSYLENKGISYDIMDDIPDKLTMYKRVYSGAIMTENGKAVSAVSYEGDEVQKAMDSVIQRDYVPEKSKNSFSEAFYMNLCILLIQAVLNMKLFISDRQNNIKERLQIMGVSLTEYMSSYLVFNWASMFLPYCISNIVCSLLFLNTSIAGCFKIMFICFVVTGLFSALALLICSAVRDNSSAIMTGNLIACFSAILSGVFGSWSSKMMRVIGKCMPQSISYTWADKVFSGNTVLNSSSALMAVLFTAIFCLALIMYRRNERIN